MTPFAPRTPYIVMSAASFSTLIDWMSYGLSPDSPPSELGAYGTPSTMYSGALFPYTDDDPPRMLRVRLPADVRPMLTPAEREARYFSTGSLGARCASASVALDVAFGDGESVSPDFGELAHAPMSASRGTAIRADGMRRMARCMGRSSLVLRGEVGPARSCRT